MHPAVELLMKRMDSNPDEFAQGHPRFFRWEALLDRYRNYLSDEEKDVLFGRYSKIQLERMHREVMAELLYGDETPSMVDALDKENARREYLLIEAQKQKLEEAKMTALKKYHKLKVTQP